MQRKLQLFLGLAIFCSFVYLPQAAYATNPVNYVISDADLTDADSMSTSWIQEFLAHRGSLGGMSFFLDNSMRSAADVISYFSHEYNISPKYLLTRMQVEQSLITANDPSQYQLDWATGYARCDGCSPEQAAEYRGFVNQVRWGAKKIRESYLADLEAGRTTISGWKPGITKQTLDGISVTPENNATAVLYTYTPWAGELFGGAQGIGGVGNFHRIFTEWFGTTYTDGTLLQDMESGGIYLIRNGKKYPFISRAAFFANYDLKKVIQTSPNLLDSYPTSTPIKYPDFSLLRSPGGTVYLYQKGTIRGIASREVLYTLGFNPEEIIDAQWADLDALDELEPITISDVYPGGALLQYKDTGGVVYIDPKGIRHPIIHRDILTTNFKNRSIIPKTRAEIEAFPLGDRVKFPDGELVTSPDTGAVYVIAQGLKCRFDSGETFTQLGYKWENILHTDSAALALHPDGKVITLEE